MGLYQWPQPLLCAEWLPSPGLTALPPSVFQERQRLETILSLCAEYTKPDSRAAPGTTVADVQKINKELEKLQLSDDESVFEEAPVGPDTRYRRRQKGALHGADLAGVGSLGQSSAGLLPPRAARSDELLRDLTRTPPPPSSAFLKASGESAYLSILPKVKPPHTGVRRRAGTAHLPWPRHQGSYCLSSRMLSVKQLLRWLRQERICLPCRRTRFKSWMGRGGGNGSPLQYSCLGNAMVRGTWWATGHGARKESDTTERLALAKQGAADSSVYCTVAGSVPVQKEKEAA